MIQMWVLYALVGVLIILLTVSATYITTKENVERKAEEQIYEIQKQYAWLIDILQEDLEVLLDKYEKE